MTDKQELEALLTKWNVKFKDRNEGHTIKVGGWPNDEDSTVTGYTGFYTEYSFDDNGKFLQMGAFE